jgi:inhibitor of KinA sporulation pathway (predicted exonuclease)
MPFVITDSEYTTWPGALENGWSAPGQHREIFQLAALLVDDDFNERRSFLQYVLPKINRELSPLAQQLTGVSQLELEQRGISFSRAFERFTEFVGRTPIICMNRDSAVVWENCEINELPFPFASDYHRLRPFLVLLLISSFTYLKRCLGALIARRRDK